jgi:LPS export ABC transporter protein LptC
MAFYLIRTSGLQASVGGISFLETEADLRIDKAHMVQNSKGRMEWEMWADTALVYRKKDETHLRTLKMRLYSREGKTTDITAERGVLGNQSRDITLTGNVLIRTSDGVSMRTDALRYNPKEHSVATESPIFLQGETFRLTGVGLNGNTEEGRYVLNEKVRAVITDPESRPATAQRPGAAATGKGAPPQTAAGEKTP